MADLDRPKTRNWLEFVETYQSSQSVNDVAEKLGISRNTVKKKAARLRREGVPLMPFYRHCEPTAEELHRALRCR